MWLLGCMPMAELIRKIQHQHDQTLHRLKPEEVRKIGEVLGASKKELDEWFAQQMGPGVPVSVEAPPPEVIQPYVPPPVPQSLKCLQCGVENRSNAKFCSKCGHKF